MKRKIWMDQDTGKGRVGSRYLRTRFKKMMVGKQEMNGTGVLRYRAALLLISSVKGFFLFMILLLLSGCGRA